VLLAACESERDRLPVIQTDIPFDREGTLDFLRPDGSTITTIAIEIAETDSARMRGLMQRRSLPERSGMLFLGDEVDTLSFWMANTPLPLDILFVGPDSEVVNIARRTRPYSREYIRSTAPAQFVVEVRAGFADRLGLTDSTRIRWRREAER
jgi:uncharacterized membrane protein (UPF0127 family)